MQMKRLWGIDLGGTKIEGVVLDEALRPLVRIRLATEACNGYRHVLQRIVELIDRMALQAGTSPPSTIGIGTPGSIDVRTGVIKNSNTLCLNGKPFRSDIEALLERQVLVDNDANCFALAEYRMGSGKMLSDSATVFGIILGTGVGGGIVCGGRLHHGAQGIAGEWGHNELIPGGEPCYCGRRGCVETVISGPALERYYSNLTGQEKALAAIASGDDDASRRTIARLQEYFGKALAGVINVLDPDMVIIGGGVGNIDALYSQSVRYRIASHVFNGSFDTPVVRPRLGDSAGVFGAALLTAY